MRKKIQLERQKVRHLREMKSSQILIKAGDEEAVLGVIVKSEYECALTQNSVRNEESDIVTAMGVPVDRDSESDEYQERTEDCSATCYSLVQNETWKDVDLNPGLAENRVVECES